MYGGGGGVGGDGAPLGGGGGGHRVPLVGEDVVALHHVHDVAVAVVEPTDVLQVQRRKEIIKRIKCSQNQQDWRPLFGQVWQHLQNLHQVQQQVRVVELPGRDRLD